MQLFALFVHFVLEIFILKKKYLLSAFVKPFTAMPLAKTRVWKLKWATRKATPIQRSLLY